MTDDIFESQEIRDEYNRWLSAIGTDPYASKSTIGIYEVLKAHFLLMDFFGKTGEGVGGIGPKDINLLHSALGRQFVKFEGKPKWENKIDICATLMFGLIKNHPFHDANKRTAFLTSILHLQKIHRTPTVSHQDYEDFTVAIADNRLQGYAINVEAVLGSQDNEVRIISSFLKSNTRRIDLRFEHNMTYNDLNAILRQHGLRLQKPKGNRIDVVRTTDTDGNKIEPPKRIAHIGFHAWTREVSRKDTEIVRRAAELDPAHGYDSPAFYHNLEDPLSLIRKYKEPLQRLAFR